MLAPLCSFVVCSCLLIYMCSDSQFGEIDLCSISDQLHGITMTSRYVASYDYIGIVGRMCWSLNPTRTQYLSGKQEAFGITGQTPEGSTKATPQEPPALSVPGRLLQSNVDQADPHPTGNTVVYSVNPTALYSIQGHIQGTPATILVDTGTALYSIQGHIQGTPATILVDTGTVISIVNRQCEYSPILSVCS